MTDAPPPPTAPASPPGLPIDTLLLQRTHGAALPPPACTPSPQDAYDGVSLFHSVDDALARIETALLQARALAWQAAEQPVHGIPSLPLDEALRERLAEIDRIADGTRPLGQAVLGADGPDAPPRLSLDLELPGMAHGHPATVEMPTLPADTRSLGLRNRAVSTPEAARVALQALDGALVRVAAHRHELEQCLETLARHLDAPAADAAGRPAGAPASGADTLVSQMLSRAEQAVAAQGHVRPRHASQILRSGG